MPTRLQDLPPGVLALVLGASGTAEIARLARTCRAAHAVKREAAEHARRRLPGIPPPPEEVDAVDWLRGREVEAMRSAPVLETPTFGDLPLPMPTESGCSYYDACPWRLQTASKGVRTGGTLRKRSPLGGECFLDYRMVLVNDGPPCDNTPSRGVTSFIWLRTVLEVVETYVPQHLRGNRLGDALVEAALAIEMEPPRIKRYQTPSFCIGGGGEYRSQELSLPNEWDGDEINQGFLLMRPTCTFVSQSFLPRHPQHADKVEFWSTPAGKAVIKRRRTLSALSSAQLLALCRDRDHITGLTKASRKPALVEKLIEDEFGIDGAYSKP